MKTILVTGLLLAAGVVPMHAAPRPNVIVIVADDLGYADMSFLPQAPLDVKHYGTPALDGLARSGTYFTDAYATAPICSPSRCGLITGRYQQRWGNYWYGEGGLPASEQTLPQALKALGYATKKIGKTHLNGGPVEYPLDHGFDEFLGFLHHTWDYIRLSQKDVDAYRAKGVRNFGCQVIGPLLRGQAREKVSYENAFSTEVFTDEAIEYVTRNRGGQPFFLELEYNAVHAPTYVVPEHYAEKVGIHFVPFDRRAQTWRFPYWEPTEEPHAVFHKRWGHLGAVDPNGRKAYLAQLVALDDNVGRLLDTLDRSGVRDNTLVIFLSDNGGTINMYANNTPLRGYKYMFGEGGIRIPMIVSWPERLPRARQNSALVSAMDVYPTVLELAGGEAPSHLDGKSLVPLINRQRDRQHDSLCWSNGRDKWVIRQGDWKLCHNAGWDHAAFRIANGICVPTENDTFPMGTVLFNLKQDIGETTDRSEQHPKKVEALRGLYTAWRDRMSDPRTGKGQLKKK